jgi:hypothetical protein
MLTAEALRRVGCFVLFGPRSCPGACRRWTAVGVKVERSERMRGRTTLGPMRIRRILWPGWTRKRRWGSSHLLPPVREAWGDALRVPAPSLIWVHGRGSGDMMIDGVPDVRATEESAAAHSFREVHPTAGWRQDTTGAGRRHQLKYGQGTRATHLGGHLLGSGVRQRQGGITELTQPVIAATQQFALHRQRRVLAAVRARGQPVVVAVIR